MKFGTQRAAVAAQSFSDNSHTTSESQFCIFPSPAGARFFHNWNMIFFQYVRSYSEFLPLSNSKLDEEAAEPAQSRRLDEMV